MHSPLVNSDLNRYMQEVQRYPVLSPEDEQKLAVRYYEHGDVDAARELVLANLRFAFKVAMEYARFASPMDLVQEANLGLMEAVRRFNPYRGYRLITYAVGWIRAAVQRYILENSSVVRRGTTRAQRKVVRRLKGARRALMVELGREPTDRELATELDVDQAEIERMSHGDLSLDLPAGNEPDGATLLNVLADESPTPEVMVAEHQEREAVRRALADMMAELNPRERSILETRLLADEPATLQQLADDFGVSRERVRQLEGGVKKKLAGKMPKALAPGADEKKRPLPSGRKKTSTSS